MAVGGGHAGDTKKKAGKRPTLPAKSLVGQHGHLLTAAGLAAIARKEHATSTRSVVISGKKQETCPKSATISSEAEVVVTGLLDVSRQRQAVVGSTPAPARFTPSRVALTPTLAAPLL